MWAVPSSSTRSTRITKGAESTSWTSSPTARSAWANPTSSHSGAAEAVCGARFGCHTRMLPRSHPVASGGPVAFTAFPKKTFSLEAVAEAAQRTTGALPVSTMESRFPTPSYPYSTRRPEG